jgi:hypothetical protein
MSSQASGVPDVRQALQSAGGHFLNLIEFGILKIFIDFKVFDSIPEEGSISISELATKVKGEESLLDRFSTYLISSGILESPNPGFIAHTPRSLAYQTDQLPAGFISHVYHFFLRPMASWSAYFENTGLVEPKNASKIPLGLGTGYADSDLYSILDAEPKLAKLFNSAQVRSTNVYPLKGTYSFDWIRNILVKETERLAIVDVGGGGGSALRNILVDNEFIPPTQCAVFDLPKTVQSAETPAKQDEPRGSIQLIGGTMLEPFPEVVKGALVYQFRRVLSDFVDDDIVLALKQTREACLPDSRILIIEEFVKPGRSKFAIAQDIAVMNFGGKRRSEAMFSELAAKAGFRSNAFFEDTAAEFGVLQLVV